MADITKCTNTHCPLADECYRIKAESGFMQSWAKFYPVQLSDKTWECDNQLPLFTQSDTGCL